MRRTSNSLLKQDTALLLVIPTCTVAKIQYHIYMIPTISTHDVFHDLFINKVLGFQP